MNCDILDHRKSLPMFVGNNFATTFKKHLNTLLSFLTQNRRGVQRFTQPRSQGPLLPVPWSVPWFSPAPGNGKERTLGTRLRLRFAISTKFFEKP